MKKSFFAAAAAALALAAATDAIADDAGKPGEAGVVLRLGSHGESGVKVSTENGVAIYRGAAVKRPAVAPASAGLAAATITVRKQVIIEHHYHSALRRLRTQGFYSGHPGRSRRFTQGFYSGPAD